MSVTIELSEELVEKMDEHRKDEESYDEFIESLVSHYESEGQALWEGYGGPP